MKHWAIFLLIVSTCVRAQTDTFWLKEATVSANRFQPEIKYHKADTLLSQFLADQSVAGLFQRENYLYNRQYGLSGIQTPGFRGLSAQQTAVLWNGVPTGNPMLGLSDLSIIPSFFTDEISIEPGPSSSINGNGAMGGTFHLQNNPVKKSSISANLSQNTLSNSFTTFKMTFLKGKFYVSTKGLFRIEQNFFDYRNTYLPEKPLKQSYAFGKQRAMLYEIGYKRNDKSQFNLRSWWNQSFREIPPNMVSGRSGAGMGDYFVRTMADYIYSGQKYRQVFRAAFSTEMNTYQNGLKMIFEENKFKSFYFSSESEYAGQMGKWTGSLAVYVAEGSSSHYLQPAHQSYIQLGGNHSIHKKEIHQVTALKWMISDQRLKPFALSSFTTWTPSKGKSGFLNLSNGFRIPTLNEMYWVPGGNPELLPEKSLHAEAGWIREVGQAGYKIQSYYTPTQNLVRWYPSGLNAVSPRNIEGTVQLFGMESGVMYRVRMGKHHFRAKANWHVNYALTGEYNSFTQLDYVPIHSAYVECVWKYKDITLMLSDQFTSSRNVQGSELDAFQLMHLNVAYTRRKQSIYLDFNNLLNTQYQMIAWYPMPGFHIQVRLQLNLNDLKNQKRNKTP